MFEIELQIYDVKHLINEPRAFRALVDVCMNLRWQIEANETLTGMATAIRETPWAPLLASREVFVSGGMSS